MVFVGGPRQVGKTTLAKAILSAAFPAGRYLNWDFDEDRQDILQKRWSAKFSDENISKSLLYYAKRLNPKRATQIVATIKRPYDKNQIKIIDPVSYFQEFF